MQTEDSAERTDFYRHLGIGGQEIRNPDWETVKRHLLNLDPAGENELSLHSGDEETWLIVLRVDQIGFLVHGLGLDETEYSVLTDPAISDDIIEFWDGHNDLRLPRFACVDETLMFRAMQYFYKTGQRDTHLCWWDEDELFALGRD